jgi:hypothetical protein
MQQPLHLNSVARKQILSALTVLRHTGKLNPNTQQPQRSAPAQSRRESAQ